MQSMNAIRLLGGHLGYLWIVIKKIFSFKELHYQIQFDQTIMSEDLLLLMVTNSTTTGGGFKVSPEAKINDGKLNMILCKPLPVIKRLQYLPVIEKGKHLDRNFIIDREVTHTKIKCEEETLAQIDGELIKGKTFEIKVLPNHYQFKY